MLLFKVNKIINAFLEKPEQTKTKESNPNEIVPFTLVTRKNTFFRS